MKILLPHDDPKLSYLRLNAAFFSLVGMVAAYPVDEKVLNLISSNLKRLEFKFIADRLADFSEKEKTHLILFLGFVLFLMQGYAGWRWELGLVRP